MPFQKCPSGLRQRALEGVAAGPVLVLARALARGRGREQGQETDRAAKRVHSKGWQTEADLSLHQDQPGKTAYR